ncbi:MAG: LTA synthase family protein [Spirochaetes bacterium]|nr:LTA synthase family protein [Spirochaetota bacterium]
MMRRNLLSMLISIPIPTWLFYLLPLWLQRAATLVSVPQSNTPWQVVAFAVAADLATALLLDAVTRTLLSQRRRWSTVILLFFYFFFIIFLLVVFGFARLYERPFAWSFMRMDSLTIWKENFVSGLYELGLPHFILVGLLVITMTALAIHVKRALPIPRRTLALSALGSVGVLFLVYFLTPQGSLALVQNPLTASFVRAAKIVPLQNGTVTENDLIPSLSAFDAAPAIPAVDVERKRGKNIILYFLESTPFSAIDKKVGGKELTPNLNRLKEKSIFFERHYANVPLSINAFYNAFCGAYALPDGAWISLALPDFPVECLSQILAKQGYRALALHAGYLGYAKQKRFMQKRGFMHMLDAEKIKQPPYDAGMGPWGAADERAMIRPLVDFVSQDKSKPFLAVLFAFAPHHPYNMPDDFSEFTVNTAELKKGQRRFFNALHFADFAFGEILRELKAAGVLENTLVIAFGDHGEAFYEHKGNYNHPFFIYEENVHVPLFIYYDGVKPQHVSRVTSHVDILPTVLDLLTLADLQTSLHAGRSMLKGGAQTQAHLQAYWQDEVSGIVDRRYKFMRKGTGALELYDLIADASEQTNLAAKLPELAAEYNAATEKAFLQKRAYYKKYGNYDLVRFNPASQDK